jgi:hypothetical protein
MSVSLNVKRPAERQQLLDLLATADVLVETFRPGVLTRLGLDPVQLRARFPKLVICSITGYGQTGPAAMRAGYVDSVLCVLGRSSSAPLRHSDSNISSQINPITRSSRWSHSVHSFHGLFIFARSHDIHFLARAGVLGMMRAPAVLPVQVADIAGGTFPAVVQVCIQYPGRVGWR